MRIVLDTGVLFHPKKLKELEASRSEIVLPAMAYAERVRQLHEQGRDIAQFDDWLRVSAIIVEPFGIIQARRFAARLTAKDWRRMVRDALIAGHVNEADLLLTTNQRDFVHLGIPMDRIVQVFA